MKASRLTIWIFWFLIPWNASVAALQQDPLRERALTALHKATRFYRTRVALNGGYHYSYSADLQRNVGEGRGSERSVTVQPPGTPGVGLAYLEAFEATGDPYYREAARDVATCLLRGQLRSGGWDYRIEFDPEARRGFAYRSEPRSEGQRNVTTLDDNTTQAAVLFLSRLDRTLGFQDPGIHAAVKFALDSLLRAQYPNGAWPQRYSTFPDPATFPVRKAGYPDDWPRTWPRSEYYQYYTFNDNTILDLIRTFLEASRTYGEPGYRRAALRAADFILLAQMPDPQPGWAQQYDSEMHPVWARRFEPPAVSGRESQDILLTLLDVYRETGDMKYLVPIPPAIRYLRNSLLPDGRLARFYELQTNTPLYFTREYQLTYSDADAPTHYSFKVQSRLSEIQTEHDRLRAMEKEALKESTARFGSGSNLDLAEHVRQTIEALDEEGRWLEQGRIPGQATEAPAEQVISSATFIRNVGILCDYLRLAR